MKWPATALIENLPLPSVGAVPIATGLAGFPVRSNIVTRIVLPKADCSLRPATVGVRVVVYWSPVVVVPARLPGTAGSR